MIGMNIVQFLQLRTWLGSAALEHRLRGILKGSGKLPSTPWVHSTPVIFLSAACACQCRRAGEALACITCTLSSYLQDRFSLFYFGEVHPSLPGIKIIFQINFVFPPFLAASCLLQEWRIVKPMKSYFLWRKQPYTSEFSAWIIACIPHLLHSESSIWALANWRDIEEQETTAISGVLEITGNTASLQEF